MGKPQEYGIGDSMEKIFPQVGKKCFFDEKWKKMRKNEKKPKNFKNITHIQT
jgi:hypothetical protein